MTSMAERRMVVAQLKHLNDICESTGVSFSRACLGCNSDAPEQRFVSIACGHALCRQCADGVNSCPICMKTTTFVKLIEDEQFSRECGICLCEMPRLRDVFPHCGHSCCTACSGQMELNARANLTPLFCPFCRIPSRRRTFSLIEEGIGAVQLPPIAPTPNMRAEMMRAHSLLANMQRQERMRQAHRAMNHPIQRNQAPLVNTMMHPPQPQFVPMGYPPAFFYPVMQPMHHLQFAPVPVPLFPVAFVLPVIANGMYPTQPIGNYSHYQPF